MFTLTTSDCACISAVRSHTIKLCYFIQFLLVLK